MGYICKHNIIVPLDFSSDYRKGKLSFLWKKKKDIDYTKNQYNGDVYLRKYADSQNGMTIDQYTESRNLHYKIWCIENGEFSKETWYKLMMVSLEEKYQKLLNEMLS